MTLGNSSLQGNLSIRTLAVYRLDPTGTLPIENIIDLIPGTSANRMTLDVIESEGYSANYSVTDNALQDFSDASTHVHKELRTLTVSGVLSSVLQTGASVAPPLGAVPTVNPTRADLERLSNLENMSDELVPVGVYTPRFAIPQAFITSVSSSWDPGLSKNLRITISFKEARIIAPNQNEELPNYDASVTGNNASAGGGQVGTPEYQGELDKLLDASFLG